MDIHVHAALGGSNSCAAVSHGSLEQILALGATKTDLISQQI